jgi:hypothetical protein
MATCWRFRTQGTRGPWFRHFQDRMPYGSFVPDVVFKTNVGLLWK